jgi:hypothetical protein
MSGGSSTSGRQEATGVSNLLDVCTVVINWKTKGESNGGGAVEEGRCFIPERARRGEVSVPREGHASVVTERGEAHEEAVARGLKSVVRLWGVASVLYVVMLSPSLPMAKGGIASEVVWSRSAEFGVGDKA